MSKLSKLFTRKQIDKIRANLIDEHGNKCAVCQKPRSAFVKSLSVDHNHRTNRVRGLLCYRCNKFLIGRQTIESLVKALKYLLKYDIPETLPYDVVEELKK